MTDPIKTYAFVHHHITVVRAGATPSLQVPEPLSRKTPVMILLLVFMLLFSVVSAQQMETVPEVERVLPKALESYRWFHSHPELSKQEEKTSKRLAQELRAAGLEVIENVGGYGVIGLLKSGKRGPVVLYRADMDALPVTEATGLPFASLNKGVMHACGHDLHMSCAIGVLTLLAQNRDDWEGTILFVGQPAEEVGSGAEAILADPRFQELLAEVGNPRLALALHDDAGLPAGQVAVTPGYVTANVDSVDITIHGKGGHGAAPDLTVDPVVIGSELVQSLQTIVSRKLPPGTRAVVTVGVFQAGTKRNIISSKAELKLTIRSYEPEIRERIVEEIERMSAQIAAAHGAPKPPTVYHHAESYTPAGFNDIKWAGKLRKLFQDELGVENVKDLPPSMVGEDFSEYSKGLKIPSVIFLLGAGAQDGSTAGLHSNKFAPQAEEALRTGIQLMRLSLLEALRP